MKPSTAKSKGLETENSWVEFLVDNGVPFAERRRQNGAEDRGDISGWVGVNEDGRRWRVVSEVKSGGVLKIPEWMRELLAEIKNDGADTGHIAVRPKGKPKPENWFIIMDVPGFMRLMDEAGFLPQKRNT